MRRRLLASAVLKTVRHFPWIGSTALVLVSSAFWLWAASMTHRWIFAENGLMENFQVGCLLVGAAILAWQTGAAKQPHERLLFAALALFFLTFALREFDVRKGDWPVASTLLAGTVRNLWLGGLWLVIAWHGYRHREKALVLGWRWLNTGAGRVLLVAGLFWVLGAAVDKMHPFGSRRRNMLAEELLEANAALLMAFSAVLSLLSSRKALGENDLSTWTPAAGAHDGPA